MARWTFIRLNRYEVEECRDLTMVQSVTLMTTNSLQSTPKADSNKVIVANSMVVKNGPNGIHKPQTQIEDDKFV